MDFVTLTGQQNCPTMCGELIVISLSHSRVTKSLSHFKIEGGVSRDQTS